MTPAVPAKGETKVKRGSKLGPFAALAQSTTRRKLFMTRAVAKESPEHSTVQRAIQYLLLKKE